MNEMIKKSLQDISELPLEEKHQVGRNFLSIFMAGLVQCGADETEISNRILDLTKLCVSADHKCSMEEYDFFTKVTDIDLPYEVFVEITDKGTEPEFMEACFDFFKALDSQSKGAALVYGCTLLTVDGPVNADEIALIEKLLEM